MKKNVTYILTAIFLFAAMSRTYGGVMTISIVFNNIVEDTALKGSWGMACVVQGADKTILFDTGGNGGILLSNMDAMGIDPSSVDVIFISHNHADHTGGLWKFLAVNSNVTVYIPSSFPLKFKQRILDCGARFIAVNEPEELFPGVYSTGEMGTSIPEQSLVLKTNSGLVLVTGCSHPGIVTIAKRAVQVGNDMIYVITGGFHLGGTPEREIQTIVKELKALGVRKIGPSHCTGDRAIAAFRKAWGRDCIDAGCGAVIEIDN
jgi:7,8-dihydropterin-6-yl-methyl-4-(beta-D-ribofuranosyl)aminobenzene 5'-phosphate synthase